MNDETTACIERKRQAIAELQRQIAVMEAALAGKTILEKPRCRTIYVAQSGFGDKELYGIPYFSVDECVKSNACPPENVVKFVEVLE